MLTALDTIPGIDRIGAISLIAETGGDMARFPSAAHLCSWGGMCPGHDESAGETPQREDAESGSLCCARR